MARIVFIADTHGLHERVEVPGGDILVHAGDLCMRGGLEEVEPFAEWLQSLPHRHKIVIAGNHDFCFERTPHEAEERLTGCIYLRDQGVTLEGIRFYGSPWQPWFYDWAFNLPRGGEELKSKWGAIPEDADVVITHGPPEGHGDLTASGERAGCADLLKRMEAVRSGVHCFGHIHEGYGVSRSKHTLFINASVCDLSYEPVNPAVVVTYEDGKFRG
jgi:Icc-related predicted phosphoesterase